MLIIVAVFCIVAVIFVAFVVDIGNQRQDRRQLATGTDAAALDVGKRWADASLEPLTNFTNVSQSGSALPSGTYNCTADAQEFLNRNRVIDDTYECEAVLKNGQLASVRVYSAGTTEYQVGQAVGVASGTVRSSTTVRLSSAKGGGLRPFAVCARDPDVTAWYATARAATLAGQAVPQATITVSGVKALPPQCEQNNGNWGFVQFATQDDGVGTTNQNALAGTIINGTTDELSAYDNGDADFDEEKQVCVDDADESPRRLYDDQAPKVTCAFSVSGSGAWNNQNTAAAFDELIRRGEPFHLPLYGEIASIGNGSLTGFPIIGFAEVRLLSYTQSGANGNSITLRFLGLSSGDCCDVNAGNQQIDICDVGTPGGAVLPSFIASCQTSTRNSSTPPVLPPPPPPQVCEPTSVLSPTSLNRTRVTANGNDKDKLTTSATYSFTVANTAPCGGLEVVVDNGMPGADPSPSSFAGVGNTYTLTFDALDEKFDAGTYTILVRNNGATFAAPLSATLIVT